MEKEPQIQKVDLTKLRNELLIELKDAGILTEQGVRLSGVGMLVRKLEDLCELVDKTNLRLHFIEKKLEGKE